MLVAAVAGLRSGRVRLVGFPSATATLVPPALATAHPGLAVELDDEPGLTTHVLLREELRALLAALQAAAAAPAPGPAASAGAQA